MLPTAIIMGLLSEALKYLYIVALPWLNFQEVYGPFALSVTMMFCSKPALPTPGSPRKASMPSTMPSLIGSVFSLPMYRKGCSQKRPTP